MIGFNSLVKLGLTSSRRASAYISASKAGIAHAALFAFGVVLVTAGMTDLAHAQLNGISSGGGIGSNPGQYDDSRLLGMMGVLFTFIEGSFGALVMIAAGIGAIVSSAFGQYRAALSLLVVAIGAFILRSLVTTFFNVDANDLDVDTAGF